MEIFDMPQGSEEWFAVRAGIPTASEFATVMARGKGGGESKTRKTYLYKLAGEILTGKPAENYSNGHMERGRDMETEARTLYALSASDTLSRVGFVKNRGAGCSPDSFVGERGLLEIKTKLPHLLIELLDKDDFPPEHKAQCQGQLWITEREWIDISVYWPDLPPLVKRAYRDEPYVKSLEKAVSDFNAELADVVERVRQKQKEAA